MRILIITTFFPPLNSIASLRPYSWAKYWTLAHHQVEVLTVAKQPDPALDLNFFYFGKQDPSLLFEAVADLRNDNENSCLLNHLEIIFAGLNQANLRSLIEKYGVETCVKQLGFVKRSEALRMQRDAHALLFMPWNEGLNNGCLTGKIFEYLYSKTPILAVGGGLQEVSQKLILEAKAGVILSSAADVGKYLIAHLKNPKIVKNEIDPALLKRYDRKILAKQLLTHATTV